MTTWAVLRDRVVEALGEYDQQAVAGTTSATYSDATINLRLGEKYGDLIMDAARLNAQRFAALATLTYTADAEYVALSGASATVRWRPWIEVEDVTTANEPRRVAELSQAEYQLWRDHGVLDFAGYGYLQQGANLFLAPRPAAAVSLRITYVPEPDAVGASASPDALPSEFHHLIALEAACSFMRQYGAPPAIDMERADLRRRFMSWASSSASTGPRFVKERY